MNYTKSHSAAPTRRAAGRPRASSTREPSQQKENGGGGGGVGRSGGGAGRASGGGRGGARGPGGRGAEGGRRSRRRAIPSVVGGVAKPRLGRQEELGVGRRQPVRAAHFRELLRPGETIELGDVEVDEREFSVAQHGILRGRRDVERIQVCDARRLQRGGRARGEARDLAARQRAEAAIDARPRVAAVPPGRHYAFPFVRLQKAQARVVPAEQAREVAAAARATRVPRTFA